MYNSIVPKGAIDYAGVNLNMESKLNNNECRLHGSPYCALLNQKNCESCFVSKLEAKDQLKAAEDILHIAEALPEDGLESIINGEDCALCRVKTGEKPNNAETFAQMDMGHLHPTAEIGDKLGGGYDRGTAMTVPVQLPVCESCRRKIGKKSYLPLALGCLSALVGLALASLEPVRSALTKHGRILPFLVFLIFVFIGIIIECLVKRSLDKKNALSVNTRSKRISAIAPMLERGWFAIGERSEIPFIFTKNKLDSGILTGENQRELLDEIRGMGKAGINALENVKN